MKKEDYRKLVKNVIEKMEYQVIESYRVKPKAMKISCCIDLVFWRMGQETIAMEICKSGNPTLNNYKKLHEAEEKGMRIMILLQPHNTLVQL